MSLTNHRITYIISVTNTQAYSSKKLIRAVKVFVKKSLDQTPLPFVLVTFLHNRIISIFNQISIQCFWQNITSFTFSLNIEGTSKKVELFKMPLVPIYKKNVLRNKNIFFNTTTMLEL